MDKRTYTADQLNSLSSKEKDQLILSLQEQVQMLNENFEHLLEQLRIANQYRFGRHTEKLSEIDGQLSIFDEVENTADPDVKEPEVEEVVKAYKRKRPKGKREEDLAGFPVESIRHTVPEEKLNEYFGVGNWRQIKSDVYKRLRYEPASWTVEEHTVDVYVGTSGDHQDEFLRGKRPKDLLRNSIVTPSLGAAILNGKYVNAMPLNRIEQELDRNGIRITRQTMANWVISFRKYFNPIWERLKYHLLLLPVNQSDESPVLVIMDGEPPGNTSYMWVHRSGEFFRDRPIVLYEFQTSRNHEHPLAFYDGYQGVLVTDALEQYHLVEKKIEGLTNANCWAHARRDFADACKAIGKSNPKLMKQSISHQALELIGKIYHEENKLKKLSAEERLEKRNINVRPLVDAFFSWVREQLNSENSLPKGKTAEGLNYCLNQEKYLKVFLEDGNVPIDNSASLCSRYFYPHLFLNTA